MKTYSYNRFKMAQNLTLEELEDLAKMVEADHKNQQEGAIHLIDERGRKKLDNIGWAIYQKTKKVAPSQQSAHHELGRL